MKYRLVFLGIWVLTLASCVGSFDFGATAGDDDEYDTVYNAPKNRLIEKYGIHDKNFPDKEIRKEHIEEISDRFKIESWYFTLDMSNDTTIHNFSCIVYYDSDKIEYVVKNLKVY